MVRMWKSKNLIGFMISEQFPMDFPSQFPLRADNSSTNAIQHNTLFSKGYIAGCP